MPQLCSIVPYYVSLWSIYNFILVLLPESEDKPIFSYYMQVIKLYNHLQFVKLSDRSIRVYRSVPMEFEMCYLLVLCSQKMLAKLLE